MQLHRVDSHKSNSLFSKIHRYTKGGLLASAGFSDPHKDPKDYDLSLWMPDAQSPPADLDLPQARFLLAQVADQFCDLVVQEKMAMSEHMSDGKLRLPLDAHIIPILIIFLFFQ